MVERGDRLPELAPLRFPPTHFGTAVSLQIHVLDAGDGRLSNGSAVSLQLQWLQNGRDADPIPSLPTNISGATGRELRIERVGCGARRVQDCADSASCSDTGYFVMVCNLLGCVFSNVVEAIVLPPPGVSSDRWNAELCLTA